MALISQCLAKPKHTLCMPYNSNTGSGGLRGVGEPLLSASDHSFKKAFVTQDTQSDSLIQYSKSSIRNDEIWIGKQKVNSG